MITIQGTVESVVFASEESGFAVLELDYNNNPITVVGPLYGVCTGEDVKVTGKYVSHPVYGSQFKAEAYEQALPATAAAILKYLSSGAVKGLGPRTAKRLVDFFGDNSLMIIEKHPERLSEIKGISPQKAIAISEEYRNIHGLRAVMLELARHDVGASAAIRAWKKWGPLAMEIIRADPYLLCGGDVGVTFEKADLIAANFGVAADSPARLRAGIFHVLTHNLSNGHTCLPLDKLLKTAAGLLDADLFKLEDAALSCTEDSTFESDCVDGSRFLFLPDLYDAETYIAGRVRMMLGTTPPQNRSFQKEIKALEENFSIGYAPLQVKAIESALSNNIFILTGGPGTGKTTTLKAILSILETQGGKAALAAPTGRAAKRMSELTGRDAKTIHRLLEVDFRDQNAGGEIKFKRNEKNPLRLDAVILDEVSMVDAKLMHSLLKAMKMSCRLILVGDPDQLPSVGAGNVLRDLIDSDMIPMVHLNEIFRQETESAIVSNAHKIVRGEHPDLQTKSSDFFFLTRTAYEETAKTVVELCAFRLPKAYGYSPLWDIQVIVPSRVGALGSIELNRLLQEKLNPETPEKNEQKLGSRILREGDKVMQIKNNYDIPWEKDGGEAGAGIFNGDIGVIEMLVRQSQSILIRFEDRVAEYSFDMADEIEHAWAITVHKSQGSEFEAVIMPLMSFHPKLYYRNILYTCVTRAKRVMIILGTKNTVYTMVENHRKVLRYTNLQHLLTKNIEDG
ncbi:MAG: ATP-dependent RecD-like DNA helicase [Oscillospiraceae bacterium]|nr:ATP-dependent RecD-like DNA helicase [Oscillospiraceae bacterium]